MKTIILIVTSIISVFAVTFVILAYFEKPSSQFANYNQLAESGLIESGWVTKYIPKSAVNIHEQHDLDTNQVNVYFNYDANKSEMLINECLLIIENEAGRKYICPPLEGQTGVLTLRKDGTGIYLSHRDGLHQ